MLRIIMIFLFGFLPFSVPGQRVKQPKNIGSAIKLLDKDCPETLKEKIKVTPGDSLILLIWPWGGNYKTISYWTGNINSDRRTKLERYYSNYGIKYPIHIEKIVLLSYQAHLNNDTVAHDAIMKPFQLIERRWQHEDSFRFTIDSLRGVYIPIDLNDCFVQIDSFWSDSIKNNVRSMSERQFCSRSHFGIGMWMRNNWQLWGGSRLSKYFNELGIYHPDDMSGIILTSYHRYLTGREINLDEQVAGCQAYWMKQNQKK